MAVFDRYDRAVDVVVGQVVNNDLAAVAELLRDSARELPQEGKRCLFQHRHSFKAFTLEIVF